MNTDDATREKSRLNSLLETWSIVGLLNGKIDGSGYGNVITRSFDVTGDYFIVKEKYLFVPKP